MRNHCGATRGVPERLLEHACYFAYSGMKHRTHDSKDGPEYGTKAVDLPAVTRKLRMSKSG